MINIVIIMTVCTCTALIIQVQMDSTLVWTQLDSGLDTTGLNSELDWTGLAGHWKALPTNGAATEPESELKAFRLQPALNLIRYNFSFFMAYGRKKRFTVYSLQCLQIVSVMQLQWATECH